MRSDKEIREQIDGLNAILAQPMFRKRTVFGDNNEAALQGQIEVLEERLTEDDVCDRQDRGDMSEHVANSARDAAIWLCGDSNDKPVDGWEGLY